MNGEASDLPIVRIRESVDRCRSTASGLAREDVTISVEVGSVSRGDRPPRPLRRNRLATHFDQRTQSVLVSEVGALPLIATVLAVQSTLEPGGVPWMVGVGIYTVISIVITAAVGRLTDVMFAVLGFGGMVGVAISAGVLADPGTAHMVLALLAAVPALAAMESPTPTAIGFAVVAIGLGFAAVATRAESIVALVISGGALVMAVIVPTSLVLMLRSSLSAALERQSALSETDPLTMTLNRRGLVSRWDAEVGSSTWWGRAVGFIELDIDYFKQLNDRYGHTAGDAVLVVVAEVLTELTADAGLVARTGGEEFVVVVPVDSGRDLARFCHSLRVKVAEYTDITVSIGAVYAPVPRSADWLRRPTHAVIDELLAAADQELYAAKGSGRNRIALAESDVLVRAGARAVADDRKAGGHGRHPAPGGGRGSPALRGSVR